MAHISDRELPEPTATRQLFSERYPDHLSWLDGQTWELDVIDDIGGIQKLNRFQAALHYQAKTMGQRIVTKTIYRKQEDGSERRKLLVRAN
jgi:hypothetical protein